ncbi:MAG: DNA repair protein RecN (Recombination protein N) [Salibacteraceae bacterium]|jgi:DNA repair protein RecN (Recombination protein N)
MLVAIRVSNYVLIDQLEVGFKSGFTVITGETGAGKSIILGALSLILGGRANLSSKGNPDKKIIAEGEFTIENYNLERFFTDNDLDYFPESTSLRREIIPSGKSRAFINDTPVTNAILKKLGEKLVDIHSQHENQLLLKSAYQLAFLDAFGNVSTDVEKFAANFDTWKIISKELTQLREQEQTARQEEDYLRFQLSEIEEAELGKVNFEEIQRELQILENSDAIQNGLKQANHNISEDEVNAISLLKTAVSGLEDAKDLSSSFTELAARLHSVLIELDDINSEVEYQSGLLESNPEKVEGLRSSLDKVNHLMHKHNLTEIKELMDLEVQLESSLTKLDGFAEEIMATENKLKDLSVKMQKLAASITKKRKLNAPKLEKQISSGLHNLGMPNTQIQILFSERTAFNASGLDDIQILFSANKGFEMQALEKVASGGERSRLMLVLKKIHASVASTPTLILDEIDTGISGEVAAKTAQMLSEMSTDSQIISITHLPQVAGKANHHQEVSKTVKGEKTTTSLRTLSNEERQLEIARMLSGEDITEAALQNAAQLMR